jgi:hypothetical protein
MTTVKQEVLLHHEISTKITLRDDWAMIAAHPRFVLEYKEFIRN